MMDEEIRLQNIKAIGEQIAALREKKGYSVRSLAEKCGVNYTNICKIERGAYNVSIDILFQSTHPCRVRLLLYHLQKT